jgi:hypothetical protein
MFDNKPSCSILEAINSIQKAEELQLLELLLHPEYDFNKIIQKYKKMHPESNLNTTRLSQIASKLYEKIFFNTDFEDKNSSHKKYRRESLFVPNPIWLERVQEKLKNIT